SPGWQGSFRDLLHAAENRTPLNAPPVGVEPGWVGFRCLWVSRVAPESSTVTSIYLAADDGATLPRPKPGQFLTLRVTGAADPPPARSSSLSAAPATAEYRISVKREDHGIVSAYLHQHLHAGSVLEAAAPRGEFVLPDDDETGPVVLLSAGIGV